MEIRPQKKTYLEPIETGFPDFDERAMRAGLHPGPAVTGCQDNWLVRPWRLLKRYADDETWAPGQILEHDLKRLGDPLPKRLVAEIRKIAVDEPVMVHKFFSREKWWEHTWTVHGFILTSEAGHYLWTVACDDPDRRRNYRLLRKVLPYISTGEPDWRLVHKKKYGQWPAPRLDPEAVAAADAWI